MHRTGQVVHLVHPWRLENPHIFDTPKSMQLNWKIALYVFVLSNMCCVFNLINFVDFSHPFSNDAPYTSTLQSQKFQANYVTLLQSLQESFNLYYERTVSWLFWVQKTPMDREIEKNTRKTFVLSGFTFFGVRVDIVPTSPCFVNNANILMLNLRN